jgi:hypothetical protein
MKIVLPIRPTETELEFDDYIKFKQEIVQLNCKKELLQLLNFEEKQVLEVDFKIENKEVILQNPHYKKLFSENYPLNSLEADFLIINLKSIYKENEDKEISWIYEFLIDGFINGLSLLINISYELSLDFLNGHILGDNEQYLGKTNLVFSHLDFAYEKSYQMKWPLLKGIKLEETINWFIKNNISLNKSSNCKASRAINAFSQMFGRNDDPDSSFLFWCVLGIEALLAEGNSEISNQIKTKCILLLGEPTEFKKKITQLYNYRSRFVHGDIDFPPKLFYYDEDFENEYWDYLHFSISILIALIRKLITEDKTEFRFEYKYCN